MYGPSTQKRKFMQLINFEFFGIASCHIGADRQIFITTRPHEPNEKSCTGVIISKLLSGSSIFQCVRSYEDEAPWCSR